MTIPKTSLNKYKFAELQRILPEIENKAELAAELRRDIENNQTKLEGFDYFFTAQRKGVEYINKDVNDRIMGGIKKSEILIFMLENEELYNQMYPMKEKKIKKKK